MSQLYLLESYRRAKELPHLNGWERHAIAEIDFELVDAFFRAGVATPVGQQAIQNGVMMVRTHRY